MPPVRGANPGWYQGSLREAFKETFLSREHKKCKDEIDGLRAHASRMEDAVAELKEEVEFWKKRAKGGER